MLRGIYISGTVRKKSLTIDEVATAFLRLINKLSLFDNRFLSFDYFVIQKKREIVIDSTRSFTEYKELISKYIIDDYKKDFSKIKNTIPTGDSTNDMGFFLTIATKKNNPEDEIWMTLKLGGFSNFFEYGGSIEFKFHVPFRDNYIYYRKMIESAIEELDIVTIGVYYGIINKHFGVGKYFIGWINYFSKEIELPTLPGYVLIEPYKDKGHFVSIMKEVFNPMDQEHLNKIQPIIEAFKKKYP